MAYYPIFFKRNEWTIAFNNPMTYKGIKNETLIKSTRKKKNEEIIFCKKIGIYQENTPYKKPKNTISEERIDFSSLLGLFTEI